jgi:hypothetical protein
MIRTTQGSFTVQRTWSNNSAAANLNPCVPIPSGEVYFGAAPRSAKVVLPSIGSTATVTVDAFSTAPYPAWTLSAVDFAGFHGFPLMSFSWDNTSVQNGDTATLTVKLTGALPMNGDEFSIVSKDPAGNVTSWFLLASTQ